MVSPITVASGYSSIESVTRATGASYWVQRPACHVMLNNTSKLRQLLVHTVGSHGDGIGSHGD